MPLFPVWIQSDLFPYCAVERQFADGRVMEDAERDRRTGYEWTAEIKSYLEFMLGKARRRNHNRWDPERLWYLAGLQTLEGLDHLEEKLTLPQIRITPRTIQDIRIASLASWPCARLVDELMRLRPEMTDRKLLIHLSRVKLARMLFDARQVSGSALKRIA